MGGPGQPIHDLRACTWLPCVELTINHRTDPASRLIADNCMAIAANEAGRIDTKEGIFEILPAPSLCYKQLARRYADRPRDLQVMSYTNERRHVINGIFLKALGFAHPDQFADAPGWAEKHFELKAGVKFVFRKNLSVGSDTRVVNGEVRGHAAPFPPAHFLFRSISSVASMTSSKTSSRSTSSRIVTTRSRQRSCGF